MTRLACIFVPLFPLAARLRSEPELKGEAVAIFEGNGTTARVVAATRPARKAGIEVGMTLPQARALLPKLIARGRDCESERAAQEALLEVADSFSPRVEDAGEGVVYFDAAGLSSPPLPRGGARGGSPRFTSAPAVAGGHVSRSERPAGRGEGKTEAELSRGRVVIAAAEKAGLPAQIGIAASKLAARVAAGLPDSPTVVAEGEEARFLAPLPLEKLAPEMEIATTLEHWGIRSIGDLARLPEGEVASRLGEIGRELHATARGIDPHPLEPRLPSLCLSEGMDLEWPLLTLEPFLFLGNAALERLAARLDSQGLACSRLEVTLKLDPDGHDARAITLPAPSRDVKTLLTLVRLEIERHPPGSPVVGFTFTAQPDKPRRAQLALFGPAALSPDRLATTIARLAALLGADRIGSPRTVDGHRPERFTQVSYVPPPPPDIPRPPRRMGHGLLAIRVLRPPLELEVITDTCQAVGAAQQGPPLPCGGARGVSPRFTSALAATEGRVSRSERPAGRGEGRTARTSLSHRERDGVRAEQQPQNLRPLSFKSVHNDGSNPEIAGTVRVAAGPWSMEEGWWTQAPADRDYWDVELAEGGLYRIYRDRATNTWFADGIYD